MKQSALTFSQRNGMTPLPRQLKPDELNSELRARLWANIHSFIEESKAASHRGWSVDGPAKGMLKQWFVEGLHRPVDEFNELLSAQVTEMKELFFKKPIHRLFDFLEFVFTSDFFPNDRKIILRADFENCHAAWRVINGAFVPVSSDEEAHSVQSALNEIKSHGPLGAAAHLRQNAEFLSLGRWGDSVRESMHAVEATAKRLSSAKTLPEALKVLQRNDKHIHPALANGFSSLYGYTSDEGGRQARYGRCRNF